MPVYNSEKFLDKSLSSVLVQSFKEFELICIDDGSTDNSLLILQQYAQNDSRIKIISQPNQGQGTARNKGINTAKGQYITFMDSDDVIAPDMYERLMSSILDYKSDVALCNIVKFLENTNTSKKLKMVKKCLIVNNTPIWRDIDVADGLLSDEQIKQMVLTVPHYAWNKIYRTAFLKEKSITFDGGKLYEDVVFGLRTLLEAAAVSYINDFSYYYLIRGNSSVRSVSAKHLCLYGIFERIKQYLDQHTTENELNNNFIFFVYTNILWHYKLVPLFWRPKFVFSARRYLPAEIYIVLCRNTIFSLPRRLMNFIFNIKTTPDGTKRKIRFLGIKISYTIKRNKNDFAN